MEVRDKLATTIEAKRSLAGSRGAQLQRLQRMTDSRAHEVIPDRCLGANL